MRSVGAGVLFVFAACHGGTRTPPPLEATLAPHAPLVPFARESVTIHLKNKGDRPLALVGDAPLYEPREVAAKVDGREVVLSGTLFVDDVGAEARAPQPPRMTWDGDARFTTFALLGPGQATDRVVSVVAKPEGTTLRLEAAVLEGDAPVASLTKRETRPLEAPEARGGYRAVLEDHLTYERGAKLTEHPLIPLSGPSGTATTEPLYPQGILDSVPRATIVVEVPLPVAAPALALAAARTQAGIASGPAVWVEPAQAWVLENAEGSKLVSASGAAGAPGHWARLAEAVAADGKACLTLFDAAPEAQAKALVTALRGSGLDATSTPAKAGGRHGTLCLRATDLVPAAKALSERGLRVEGQLVQ